MVSDFHFLSHRLPNWTPNTAAKTSPTMSHPASRICQPSRATYTGTRVTSTTKASTAAVAAYSVLFGRRFCKNIARKAPWWPVSPPKKPEPKPPMRSSASGKRTLVHRSLMESRGKTTRATPTMSNNGSASTAVLSAAPISAPTTIAHPYRRTAL